MTLEIRKIYPYTKDSMKPYMTFLLSFTVSRTVDFEKETVKKQLIQLTWCQKFKNKFKLRENNTVYWSKEMSWGDSVFKNTARFVLTLKVNSVLFLRVIVDLVANFYNVLLVSWIFNWGKLMRKQTKTPCIKHLHRFIGKQWWYFSALY